jgi:hypothetical protein
MASDEVDILPHEPTDRRNGPDMDLDGSSNCECEIEVKGWRKVIDQYRNRYQNCIRMDCQNTTTASRGLKAPILQWVARRRRAQMVDRMRTVER